MQITTICNGKATIVTSDSTQTLVSYSTEVCRYNGTEFVRTGFGYKTDSQTTMRHINYFRELVGLPKITKAQWNKM
jgi:hypothetical protein